jgi:bifunctional NMN adenylyltransferase/nudix hydrolase
MTKEYDTLVFCGRFQPFHDGHKAVIEKALEKAEKVVIVVGSSFQPRTPKNPLTFYERKCLIESEFPKETGVDRYRRYHRIIIVGVPDYPYDDNAWVSAVQNAVASVNSHSPKTGLIGHSKDSSSYYLKIFPDWRNHVEVDNVGDINATDIRESAYEKGYFSGDNMPANALATLKEILSPVVWNDIRQEFRETAAYKKAWEAAPFAPTFVTTDAVLTQSGYLLLIKRGNFPYKGCWALPGGYLEPNISIEDNMIKELHEETCVRLPKKILKGFIRRRDVFDHPERDPRGRTITHGFHIDLGFPDEKLPKVKGGDDAVHAEWVPLSEVTTDNMAFDHYSIIKRFINI